MAINWSAFWQIPTNGPMLAPVYYWSTHGTSAPPASGGFIQDIQTMGVINQIGNDKFMLNTSTGLV